MMMMEKPNLSWALSFSVHKSVSWKMAEQVSKLYQEKSPSGKYCLDQKKGASRTLEGRGREFANSKIEIYL